MKNIRLEEQLEREGQILAPPVGDSMMPILRYRRDLMLLKKLPREPKVNDAVLYKRENGQYVMHRIVKIRKDGYVLRGDNRFNLEYGVKREQIIGIMVGFYRDEKFIDCDTNKYYKLYVFIMRSTVFPRRVIKFIKRKLKMRR